MGIAAMIRRLRQQDALDTACAEIETLRAKIRRLTDAGDELFRRNGELESEILRLRKNALTPTPERVDNSVVKAKSTADVRRLTEAAFGKELQEAFERESNQPPTEAEGN